MGIRFMFKIYFLKDVCLFIFWAVLSMLLTKFCRYECLLTLSTNSYDNS